MSALADTLTARVRDLSARQGAIRARADRDIAAIQRQIAEILALRERAQSVVTVFAGE